jgi:putative DNA primase/helicase
MAVQINKQLKQQVKQLLSDISIKTVKFQHQDDLAMTREALHHCKPNCVWEIWFEIVVGAIRGGLPIDEVEAWSKGSIKHEDETDGFKAAVKFALQPPPNGKGITVRTLYYHARTLFNWKGGFYQHSATLDGLSHLATGKPAQASAQSKVSASLIPTPPKRTATPLNEEQVKGFEAQWQHVFEKNPQKVGVHPYVLAHNGEGSGLAVVPDTAKDYAGFLVVPYRTYEGRITAFQFIAPYTKTNEKGKTKWPKYTVGDKRESFFSDSKISDPHNDTPVYFVEGIGALWGMRRAGYHDRIVVVFGMQRFATVSYEVRRHLFEAPLIHVQDAGQGALDDAVKASHFVGGSYLVWPGQPDPTNPKHLDYPKFVPSNTGVDDLTAEQAKALIASAVKVHFEHDTLSARAFQNRPSPRWRLQNIVPEVGVVIIYGPPKVSKTAGTMHMVIAIAEGKAWFGLRSRACRVTYAALEGVGSLKDRLDAWEEFNKRPIPASVRIWPTQLDLRSPLSRQAFVEAINRRGGAEIVVIDTLFRAMPGADENNVNDVRAVMDGVDDLATQLQAAIIIVHHTGKDVERGARGSNSIIAAVDIEIPIVKDGKLRKWTVKSSRIGPEGITGSYAVRGVELGFNEFDEPRSGVTIEPDGEATDDVGEPDVDSGQTAKKYKSEGMQFMKSAFDFLSPDGTAMPFSKVYEHAAMAFKAAHSLGTKEELNKWNMRRDVGKAMDIGKDSAGKDKLCEENNPIKI